MFLILWKFLEKVLVSFILKVGVPVLALLRLVQAGTLLPPPEPALAPLHGVAHLRLSNDNCRTFQHFLTYWQPPERQLGQINVVVDYLKVVLLVISLDDAVAPSMESRRTILKTNK